MKCFQLEILFYLLPETINRAEICAELALALEMSDVELIVSY